MNTTATITKEQIAKRLSEVEIFAESYTGRVPKDWQEVAESADLPSVQDVLDEFANQVEAGNIEDEMTINEIIDWIIDCLISLPDAYKGVAFYVRTAAFFDCDDHESP